MALRRRAPKAHRHHVASPEGRSSQTNETINKWRAGAMGGAVLAILVAVAFWASGPAQPAVLRPFPGVQLKQLPQFAGSHADRLLWGTYRPGYYFGMRTRHPSSLLVGLMWMDPQRADPLDNIRHEAQQRDGLAKYGWLQHDGRGYGVQELRDEQYNITTAWAKNLCLGCGLGGDWGVSISFQDLRARAQQQERRQAREAGTEATDEDDEEDEGEEPPRQAVSLFVYVAAEDGGEVALDVAALAAALQPQGGEQPPTGPVIAGSTPPVGGWQLHARGGSGGEGGSSGGVLSVSHLSVATPHTHNLTDLVRHALVASVRQQHAAGQRQYRLVLPDVVQPGANLAVLQVTALLPLRLDLAFTAGLPLGGGGTRDSGGAPPAQLQRRVEAVTGAGLRRLLAEGEAAFEARFAAALGAPGEGGGGGRVERSQASVARAAVSNMLGGMGYWYGHSLVRLSRERHSRQQEATARLWDAALYSAVPSRSFFPRGFLWDEGFHQLLIRRWDAAVSREVLAHWLDLMNAQGWVAREQILGQEARSRVPDEFVRQSPDAANPPTFFLLLSDMSQRVAAAARAASWSDDDLADAELLRAAWPRLRAWYLWFNSTQAGPVPGSYRWRGRDGGSQRELNPKTLASGLDDAPRASHPSGDERHLDLRCWMALAARAMATIGANLGLPRQQVAGFQREAALLEDLQALNALHLHPATGEYRDWGNHTEDVALQRPLATLPDGRQVATGEQRRVVVGRPPSPQLVPQFSYISLFPLLMRLIPPHSPLLGRQLELLGDPQRLWTPHGLRSLSRSASLYQARNTEHDPPYWRGAVWVNINFLAVEALHHYASAEGPHQGAAARLHGELRRVLVDNIVRQYERTGYLWEQYDDTTGEGKGSHPFTGWTALVALMAGKL